MLCTQVGAQRPVLCSGLHARMYVCMYVCMPSIAFHYGVDFLSRSLAQSLALSAAFVNTPHCDAEKETQYWLKALPKTALSTAHHCAEGKTFETTNDSSLCHWIFYWRWQSTLYRDNQLTFR